MSAPLVLLHGFAGGPQMWDPVVARLGEEIEIARPWLPGHGPTDIATHLDFEGVCAALCDRFPSPRLVVGYSLGGRIALGMAVRSSLDVVLVGAHPGLAEDARAERCAWERTQAARLLELGIDAFMDEWERMPIFATQTDAQRRAQRAQRQGHDAAGLAWAMETLGTGRMPDYRAVATGCWITGERDEKFTTLARGLAVEHRIAAGAGHNVVLEAPDVVVEEIERRLGPTSRRG